MPTLKGSRKTSTTSTSALLEVVDEDVGQPDWNPDCKGSSNKNAPETIAAYKTTLIWIAVCLLIAFTCAMIPSAFLLARANDCSSVKSENKRLDRTNYQLLQQAENYSSTVDNLADQLVNLQNMVWNMQNKMKIQKDSLTSLYDVTFVAQGNKSVEYALVNMGERITWNQADLFCKSIQSKLAYPDANIQTSVEDLKLSCEATNESCCACWVGLTKQYEENVWQTSDGDDAVTTEKMWAPGQEFVKKHPDYDCAYIFNGLLYSMYCNGNSSQNHSQTLVADRFVCQSLVKP